MKMAFVVMALALFGSVNAFAENPEASFRNLDIVCPGQTALDFTKNVFTLSGNRYKITAIGAAEYQKVGQVDGYTKPFNFGRGGIAYVRMVRYGSEPSFNIFVNLPPGDGFVVDDYSCVEKY